MLTSDGEGYRSMTAILKIIVHMHRLPQGCIRYPPYHISRTGPTIAKSAYRYHYSLLSVALSQPISPLGPWVAACTIEVLSLKTILVPEHFEDGTGLVCGFLLGGTLIKVASPRPSRFPLQGCRSTRNGKLTAFHCSQNLN